MIDHLRQNTFGQDGLNNLDSANLEEDKTPDKQTLDKQYDEMEDDDAQTTAYQG